MICKGFIAIHIERIFRKTEVIKVNMEFKRYKIIKDLIVVGGGLPGICAAIQAARHGLSVALINNRGYLGGNSGAEAYVSVSGATGTQEFNFYARESGIVEELMLENRRRNQQGNRFMWDTVLLDFVFREKNIELFQNTNVDMAEVNDNKKILYVSGVQSTTEKRFDFYGEMFLDDTGDGALGYLSGAEFKKGREAKQEFGETLAPDKSDHYVLPSTLYFTSHDIGRPVKYTAPDFALDITKTDALKYRVIPKDNFYRSQWYYEVGGELDQIDDNEEIIQKHRELAYGIWDYIKNSGEYDSENYDLTYVSCIPGKRESRRLMGDYVLKEQDILEQRDFEDTVGYGGWSIDLHALEGFFSKELINQHIYLKGIYQIPYRAGYSRNIENLFMAGRCMSTSHVAFGSTRVMATLSTLGQALGTAAYLCKKHGTNPRGIYQKHMDELQKLALKNDQFIIGKTNIDEDDLTNGATIETSSVKKCEITKMDAKVKLEKDMAIIIPVKERIETIRLLVKSSEDVELKYAVYVPKKKENYNPETKLCENSVFVKAQQEFTWIDLPINQTVLNNKVFIEFRKNNAIEIAVSYESLIGVNCMQREATSDLCIVDCNTFKAKDFIWKRVEHILCFMLSNQENIYGAHNLNNGYIRPYGLPNAWISDNKVQNEYIQISFIKPKNINNIVLTFDSNLDLWLWNTGIYENHAFPETVKDYTVYYKINGKYEKLAEVKNNCQRVNKINFETVQTDEIKIVFDATNGSEAVRVFGINIY